MIVSEIEKELKKHGNQDQLIISWTVLDKILENAKIQEQKKVNEIIYEISKKD